MAFKRGMTVDFTISAHAHFDDLDRGTKSHSRSTVESKYAFDN